MNDIMASSDLSSLGNFAALTGTSTSWVSVSQGTVTIRVLLFHSECNALFGVVQ